MTPETRKTLEACAKVMGYGLARDKEIHGHRDDPYSITGWKIVENGVLGRWWNPLTSVADASEMAIKLKIDVSWWKDGFDYESVRADYFYSGDTISYLASIKDHPSEQHAYCYAVCKVAEQLAEVM